MMPRELSTGRFVSSRHPASTEQGRGAPARELRRGGRGFTIAEVLVGVLLAAIIAGTCVFFLSSSSRSSRRAFAISSAMQSYTILWQTLGRDVGRAFTTPSGAFTPTGDPTEARLAFPILDGVNPAPVPVTYVVKPNRTVERQGPPDGSRSIPVSLDRVRLVYSSGGSSLPDDLVWMACERQLPAFTARTDTGDQPGTRVVLFTAFGLPLQARRRAFPGAVATQQALAMQSPQAVADPGPEQALAMRLDDGDREDGGLPFVPPAWLPPVSGRVLTVPATGDDLEARRRALEAAGRLRQEAAARLLRLERAAGDTPVIIQPGISPALTAPFLRFLEAEMVITADEAARIQGAARADLLLGRLRRQIQLARERERELAVAEARARQELEGARPRR
ncbi:MAG: hypothetical protein HY815_07825 [Candidatus Riflebacteria bacterium]|nr:hypothetical protein [Candidatus Riflebacteria bacterium]